MKAPRVPPQRPQSPLQRMGMFRTCWLVACTSLLGAGLRAQPVLQPNVNFFGSDSEAQQQDAPATRMSLNQRIPREEEAYAETLEFKDGRVLHGKLVSKPDEDIVWQRPDASERLLFPRRDVQRIVTTGAKWISDDVLSAIGPELSREAQAQRNGIRRKPASGTTKMPGEDGLFGNVSAGQIRRGSSFASAVTLPLAALPLLVFAIQPLPGPQVDLLVFKDGDELPGKALSATLPGPVRWRTMRGQVVEFRPDRVAGLRLAGGNDDHGAGIAGAGAMVELRTGERLQGKLLAFDGKQLRLEHPQLGAIVLDCDQLWHLFPDARLGTFDGGRGPGGWKWATSQSPEPIDEPPSTNRGHWVYLDGTYLLRGGATASNIPTSILPGWQHPIDPSLERFEVRFEMRSVGGFLPCCAFTLFGGGGITLCATVSSDVLSLVVMNPQDHPGGKWRPIHLDKLRGSNRPIALRFFVDTNTGTCDIVINGEPITRIGKKAGERLVKTDYYVRIQPNAGTGSLLFSNLWIGPWIGELPQFAAATTGVIALANGDLAPGLPKTIHDGSLFIDSDIGELSFPMEKVVGVDFGGAMDAPHAAARMRLADGTAVNVDAFTFDEHGLSAHSATLGELHVPLGAVAELVYAPATQNEAPPPPKRE